MSIFTRHKHSWKIVSDTITKTSFEEMVSKGWVPKVVVMELFIKYHVLVLQCEDCRLVKTKYEKLS